MKAPVLVLGWIPRIVAVIARSLHRHGVPVDVADMSSQQAVRSRAIRGFTRLPDPDANPSSFVDELRHLIQSSGYSMLIPTNDQALTAVARHYDEFKDMLHVSCPPPHITHRILNKILTLEAARKSGIPVPKTAVVSNSDELPALLHRIALPWILKPAEKQSQMEEFKTCMVTRPEELASRFPVPRQFAPPILVQEYCGGVGLGIEVLLHDGDCRAVFQHRRLKELPHTGGYAVMAVAEAPDPDLVHSAVTLLHELQWDGVAMVEFRVNPADNRAVLMEVNGRYWGSISLAVLAGVDFPLYHWKLVHGESIQVPSTYRVGTNWRWTAGYLGRLHWLSVAAVRSAAARKTLLHDLADLPADCSPAVCDALFDSSDPMAAVFDLLGMSKYLLDCDLRALFRARRLTRSPG